MKSLETIREEYNVAHAAQRKYFVEHFGERDFCPKEYDRLMKTAQSLWKQILVLEGGLSPNDKLLKAVFGS